MASRNIYREVRAKFEVTPTARIKYANLYEDALKREEICQLPFKAAIDSRSRAFQFRVLHRYLATSMFFHKIGWVNSPLCSFLSTYL